MMLEVVTNRHFRLDAVDLTKPRDEQLLRP